MKAKFSFLLVCILILMAGSVYAQPNDAVDTPPDRDPLKYAWQFDVRGGYDFVFINDEILTYGETRFHEYKGGPMVGASASKYWNWIGVGLDFDWMRNKINVETSENDLPLRTLTENINRFFVGAGPNFKYQIPNNKYSLEVAPRIGIALAKGGEALVYYEEQGPNLYRYQSYKSGFERKAGLGAGVRVQNTYWFHDNVGVHAGASYLFHHNAPYMSESNFDDELNAPGFFSDTYLGWMASMGDYRAMTDGEYINAVMQTDVIKDKTNIHSVNVFGGISARFGVTPKPPKAPKDVTSDIEVTVEDKQTGGVLEGATVQLFGDDGSLIGTQLTSKKGETVFKNIAKGDYSIKGMYNEMPTTTESVSAVEFKNKGLIEKTLFYDNPNFTLNGLVKECFSSKAVSEAHIKIRNIGNGNVIALMSDAKGEFTTPVEPNSRYSVVAEKKGYFSNTVEISTATIQPNGSRYVELEICITETECNTAIRLDNILYDLDKFYIRADAKPELNRVVQFMKDNPEVRIEMSSHTDSRASHGYNQTLSQNRAKAAVDYIISQGISRDRLVAVGYGETQLLNRCKDDVPCTEAEHQLNRRTEFKVICPE
ncbi:MAG: OmpA family protein [Bacteroidetes bacterium]|nr:OmpA family protein [Bacteroidota bacterium]